MTKWFDSDDFLLQRLASGDEKALEFLFRSYYADLKKVSYRVVGNNELAKDIVQEVFATIWVRRRQLEHAKPIKSYLFRAVINRSLNQVRDHPKLQIVSLDALKPEQHATQPNETSARLEAHELQALITGTIQQLPPQCRLAFQLSRDDEMSYQEIADRMGISVKAVEKHISKALKKLRNSLHAYLKHLLLFNL